MAGRNLLEGHGAGFIDGSSHEGSTTPNSSLKLQCLDHVAIEGSPSWEHRGMLDEVKSFLGLAEISD